MEIDLLLYFLILTLFWACNSQNECDLEGHVEVEKKLNERRILTISMIGRKQCSAECSSTSGCLSFNYERSTFTCDLNYADKTTKTLSSDNQAEYHEPQTNKFIGECNSTICGLFSRCVNIKFYGPFCIPKFCPEPLQSQLHGTLVPNGENAVGKDRSYICDTGYILAGSPNITCQSDGQWSTFQSCRDCGEPPTISNAYVSPGSNLIGSTRTYTCQPEHFTEGTTSIHCQSNGIWSSCSLYCRPYRWPLGTYGLYKTTSGCPAAGSSWSEGSIVQDMEDSNPGTGWDSGIPTYMAGSFTYRDIKHFFCMRVTEIQTVDDLVWPPGSYCILQKYSCPSGFSNGFIFWDDEDSANYNSYQGTLPEYATDYSKDTKLGYCCRQDALPTNPIILPTSAPFYLLRKGDSCQVVSGMNVNEHYIRYDVEDSNPTSTAGGSYPYVSEHENWNLKFCYYFK